MSNEASDFQGRIQDFGKRGGGGGVTVKYYNKEYREGVLREFLLTAAVDSHRSRRLRWLSTAKVGKNPRGTIPTVFLYFIYRSRPPKKPKYVKKDG